MLLSNTIDIAKFHHVSQGNRARELNPRSNSYAGREGFVNPLTLGLPEAFFLLPGLFSLQLNIPISSAACIKDTLLTCVLIYIPRWERMGEELQSEGQKFCITLGICIGIC